MPDPIQGVNAADALNVASTGQTGSPQAAVRAEKSGAGAPVDSADVAWAEALLATVAQAAAAVPPVDQTRVAQLQQAINSGTYQANPQQIAEKILEVETLLASRGKTE
jgi:negative regulator of flagellin synthesis FlgM